MLTDWLERNRTRTRVLAVVLPLVAAWLLYLVAEVVGAPAAALVLVLLVVAGAATGDRPTGILAGLASAAGFDFFLTEASNKHSATCCWERERRGLGGQALPQVLHLSTIHGTGGRIVECHGDRAPQGGRFESVLVTKGRTELRLRGPRRGRECVRFSVWFGFA